MDHQYARSDERADVEEVSEIVSDDAIVVFAGGEDIEERNEAGAGWDRAYRSVPSSSMAAGEIDDDVERAIEQSELVNPSFVAIEDQQPAVHATHRWRRKNMGGIPEQLRNISASG
jgi:hypothetical protein